MSVWRLVRGWGLIPQMGLSHVLRPGRTSLALDLMEELRSVVADRLVLNLVNRGQVKPGDFEVRPGRGVDAGEGAEGVFGDVSESQAGGGDASDRGIEGAVGVCCAMCRHGCWRGICGGMWIVMRRLF